MHWISFLYTLIGKHVVIASSELKQLELDCKLWYESEANKDNRVIVWLKKYSETWYAKTALAVLFIFASRWLLFFMNPDIELGEDDEDDDK